MFAQMPLPLREFERDGDVGVNGGKCFGKRGIGLARFQKFDDAGLHALSKSLRVLFECLVDITERAELFDKPSGGLLAYPLNAGNVVRRVAAERFVIHDALRPESVPLAYALFVVYNRVGQAFAQREYAHPRSYKLQSVHITRRDDCLKVAARA